MVAIAMLDCIKFLLLAGAASAATPEQRAIDYLAREVPRWSSQNHCYSCHNNGDGARALFAARRLGYKVPADALRDTTAWLVAPGEWDRNHGNPLASDRKLARLQFAAALAESEANAGALIGAADSLLPYQEKDGSWQVDSGAGAGSPVTYGPVLATWIARRTLAAAGAERYAARIARADTWLRAVKPANVPDAAVLLMAVGTPACPPGCGKTLFDDRFPGENACDTSVSMRFCRNLLDLIRGAQASDGGWGPRAHSPSEVFDTALVLLAIRHGEMAQRGRAYLIRTQLPSGGWPETTRPSGGQSYAQHISTSAWAALALLATHPER